MKPLDVFLRYLPAYAQRVGISSERDRKRFSLPPSVTLLETRQCPRGSLHGIYCNANDAPTGLKSLTSFLETLAPGGIAVLHLPEPYDGKVLAEVCAGGGWKLLYWSRSKAADLFDETRIRSYPHGRAAFGRFLFAVIQNPARPRLEGRTEKTLSVVAPVCKGTFEKTHAVVCTWTSFLKACFPDEETEIIVINDAILSAEEC